MRRTNKKKSRKGHCSVERAGFTLIEILFVMAILSIVSLAVYSSFDSGIKIWQRLNKDAPAEDLNIFLEKISDDLRNSFKFTGIEFVGRDKSISFATLVLTELGQRDRGLIVGEVGYGFDEERETLNRWYADYSRVYQDYFRTLTPPC